MRAAVLFCALFLMSCTALKMNEVHLPDGGMPDKKAIRAKYEPIIGAPIKKRYLPLYCEIDSWMGVPYRYGGKTRKGTDCSGFTCNVYTDLYSIMLPHSSEEQFGAVKHIGRRRLKTGELVFFATDKSGNISHVGVYLANGKFVHASTTKGVRIDNLEDDYYRRTYRGAGRWKPKH